jgi:hypothetical protein
VLVAPLLGLLGVLAAEVVPDGRIGYHLVRARAEGVLEPVERPQSPLGTTVDQFSECVAFGIGLGDPPDSTIWETALASPSYFGCEELTDELDHLVETDTLSPGGTYLRYWHGYAVFSRPALGAFGVAGARWLAFALLATTVVGFAALVKRAFGWVATGLLVGPAVLTTDMTIGGLSMHQSLGIATAWTGAWAAFVVVKRHPRWQTAALVAALAGTLNAYVDLMTTIPGALAVTAFGAALGACANGGDPELRRTWRLTLAAVVGWVVGMAWMWASKWLLATTAVGIDEVVDNVWTKVEFRLSGEYESVDPNRLQGLWKNLAEWWSNPLTPWVIGSSLVVLVGVVSRARTARAVRWRILACVGIVAVPVVMWFVALNNHSQIHDWLVYRSLPIAFGGACAFVCAAASMRSRGRTDSSSAVASRQSSAF